MKVNQKTEKAVRNEKTYYSIPVAFKMELNEKQFHKLLQIRNLKSDLKQEFESSAFIAQLSEVLTDAIVRTLICKNLCQPLISRFLKICP